MFKWLLVIAVVYLVYKYFIKKPVSNNASQADKKENVKTNDMVQCDECGIFVSIDETILSNGKHYCSKECLEKKR